MNLHDARVLKLHGHEFSFSGSPGQATSVVTQWGIPFEDEIVRSAYQVIESSLLALYSAGVLYRDGNFSPAVVDAFQAVFDQVPNCISESQAFASPRVLVIVSGGVADTVADSGVNVEVFDWDNYNDDPAGYGGVSADFSDLAIPSGIPVGDANVESAAPREAI